MNTVKKAVRSTQNPDQPDDARSNAIDGLHFRNEEHDDRTEEAE